MKEVKIKVYEYNELDNDTKEKIIQNWRIDDEFYYGQDIVETLKAFCNHFNITLMVYSLGGYDSYIRIDQDTIPTNKKDLKISKKFLNSYALTGVCFDYDILEPLTYSFKGKTPHVIVDECLNALIECYEKELEHWYSAECIEIEIEMNDYDFLKNGDVYNYQF
jgi:hypothetical protein